MSRFCFFVVHDLIQIEMSPSSSPHTGNQVSRGPLQSGASPILSAYKLSSPEEFVRHFLGVFITHEERSVCWVGSNYRHFHSRE